jgi:hypothetical protein
MADGNITEREFGRTMTLLEELRDGIHTRIDALSSQLDRGVNVITTRQDTANGRTNKNEAAVVAATEQIEAVAEQVKAVQETVSHIDSKGCSRITRHEQMVNALSAVGVVPDAGEVGEPVAKWTRNQKVGLAGFAALIAVASPVIIKLIELASAWVQHISVSGVGK